MLTVIILTSQARRLFDSGRRFFDPFVERGDIVFCDWNEQPAAVTLADALPKLPDLIRGHDKWRAVVVDHVPSPWPASRYRENPFDFTDNSNAELSFTDASQPLVRISHILLGYPDLTARGFEPRLSYRDRDTGERVPIDVVFDPEAAAAEADANEPAEEPEVEDNGENGEKPQKLAPPTDYETAFQRAKDEAMRRHFDVRVVYEQVDYPEDKRAEHAKLVEQYRMKEVPPSEVAFISTRRRLDEDAGRELQRAWLTETEHNSSRFVQRNDYPASTRFAVYDLMNPESSGYDQDVLRFWLSVLTLSLNDLPPSSFQAERVYRLGVDFSEESLGQMLNGHMTQLTAAKQFAEERLAEPAKPPEFRLRELVPEQSIAVHFEEVSSRHLEVSTTGYGLATDKPTWEQSRWLQEFTTLRGAARDFIRTPRRILAHSVDQTKRLISSFLETRMVLDQFEREEIVDDMTKRVRKLAVPTTADILNPTRVDTLLTTEDSRVRRHIATRMRLQTILVTMSAVALIWLVTMLPYLLQAGRRGGATLGSSLIVVIVVIAISAGVGLVSLLLMRRRLIGMLRNVNLALKRMVLSVVQGGQLFSEFLSDLATYMLARATLIGSTRARDAEMSRLRHLAATRVEILRTIDLERRIVTSLGEPLVIQRANWADFDLDLERENEARRIFQFPVGDTVAQFNDTGESIDAPYEFVSRLWLARLRIFEPEALQGKSEPDSAPVDESQEPA